jgi:tetratricopeptide (TPR) repeat protein
VNAACLLLAALPFGGGDSVEVRTVDGEALVDASATSISPAGFLARLAEGSGRELRGQDALAESDPLDVQLQSRPLGMVLRAVALATNTEVTFDAHVISISPAREPGTLDGLDLEAQAAWLRLVRDFPDHEASRIARLQLGRAQERLGHEEAALAHYDAAVRADVVSPAMEEALLAASDLCLRRGEWGEAQRRLSQLAVQSAAESVRIYARITTARTLALQGRGAEALNLLDAVDLSYPPSGPEQVHERLLVRARGQLAAGNAAAALAALDRRAVEHASFGQSCEDLELRARALDALGAPLEAARAWLAVSTLSTGRERASALAAAARLADRGGDDIALLFISRLAADGAAESSSRSLIERLADDAQDRLGLTAGPRAAVEALERRWERRAGLTPSDRVDLAVRCIPAIADLRSVEEAALVARTALSELDGADGRPMRAALAASYERRGLWSQAARVWGGGDLESSTEVNLDPAQ